MDKIERKYLAHYIDVSNGGEYYERLGTDLEEYSAEMNAQVVTKRNILGQNTVRITGYEKTGSVETYYAQEGSYLFERLQEIIDRDKVMDDLKVGVVEVKLWKPVDGNYEAVCEEAYIEVLSYGGDTSGYQIPFKLHYVGNKIHGYFDINTCMFTQTE